MTLERYSAPVLDKAGKYYGRIWTFRDISDRKRLKTALAREEDLLETTIKFAGDAEKALEELVKDTTHEMQGDQPGNAHECEAR